MIESVATGPQTAGVVLQETDDFFGHAKLLNVVVSQAAHAELRCHPNCPIGNAQQCIDLIARQPVHRGQTGNMACQRRGVGVRYVLTVVLTHGLLIVYRDSTWHAQPNVTIGVFGNRIYDWNARVVMER